MKPECIIKLVLVIGVVAFILKKTATKIFDAVTFRSVKAKYISINLNALKLKILLVYNNANSIPINIDNFNGSINYGNITLSNLTAENISLAPGKDSEISINSEIKLSNLAVDLITAITKKEFINDFYLIGSFTVKGISFPINEQIVII